MKISIHTCDVLDEWSSDFGALSLDAIDKKEGAACVVDTIGNADFDWTRLVKTPTVDLSPYRYLRFWFKTQDASKRHNLILRNNSQNYAVWNFSPFLVSNTWVMVEVDLLNPTSVVGNFNIAAVRDFIFEIWTEHAYPFVIKVDDIVADTESQIVSILHILPTDHGTTDPPPGDYSPIPSTVKAIPDSGYDLDYWLLDGVKAGSSNPINLSGLTGEHQLQAVFKAVPIEFLLYQSNFAGGTIDPFNYLGDQTGSATVLPPEQDPLGGGEACCELVHHATGNNRVSIGFINFGGSKAEGWVVYGSLRIKTTQMRTDVQKWSGIAHIRHPDLYGVGSAFWYAQLEVFDGKLRLKYYNNGSMLTEDFLGVPQPNVKEDYELYVRTGNGNGVISLLRNGVKLFERKDLVNHNVPGITPSGSIGSLEIGTAWGAPDNPVYVYDVKVYASEYVPFPKVKVKGQVLDENGNPIQNVGVRVGKDIDPNVPWVVDTFWAETFTDENGYFEWEDDPEKDVPLLRFVKLGYGDPALPVGSVTMIKDALVTPSSGTLDLGQIILKKREPIKPMGRPAGRYWPIRSILIFPYTKHYGSSAFHEQVKLIKQKGFPFNYIEVVTRIVGDSKSTLHAATSADAGYELWDIDAVMQSVDMIHEEGFKAILRIYVTVAGRSHIGITDPDPEWIAGYKRALVEDVLPKAIQHKVDILTMQLESYTFAGQDNAGWLDIISTVRNILAESGSTMKLALTMNTPTSGAAPLGTTYSQWQSDILKSREIWEAVDVLIDENWIRLSTKMDATEDEIINHWHNYIEWDAYHPDYAVAYAWIKSQFPNQLLIMNCGFSNSDECAIYPWTGRLSRVQNQEAQALAYKATFDFYQNVELDGWLMEHYSFDPNPQGVTTNCFNGMYCEDFIKEGLKAHAQEVVVPPPPKPPYELHTLLWIFARKYLKGITAIRGTPIIDRYDAIMTSRGWGFPVQVEGA